MSDNKLKFEVSAGLKNIIGRDLITNDFIAVFELVKNSFDAYAKNVVITFGKNKIVIADDGKGMSLTDIKEKWLLVAYSAKKEGLEDDQLKQKEYKEYRDNIKTKTFFAGAKGIGRFSCDRLGDRLTLTTKSAANNSVTEQLEVKWSDFEEDPEEKFINIAVTHRTLNATPKDLKHADHGTILEISDLNSIWTRKKKLELKYSLEKLINPFKENRVEAFSILINDESEIENDKKESDQRDWVNGKVKNFVFETLEVKTTNILTEIDKDGESIYTTLIDRGTLIYKTRKTNNTRPLLKNIKFHLFFLNKTAKHNFTRLMGMTPIDFGSIFLYKNGFRISPYGNYGVDYWGIDSRHTQAIFRTLGLRDLIGRIEILDDESNNFREISNRDGGLVKNEYYDELINCFMSECLRKLEKYVTSVQFTSKDDKNNEDLSALENIKAKSALLKLINSEISNDTELIDIDKTNLSIRTQELLKDASSEDIDTLKLIADKLNDSSFKKESNKTESEHKKLVEMQAKLDAEEAARIKAEKELELEKEKNTYLRTSDRTLSDDAKGLVHNIKITARAINSNVNTLYDQIKNGKIKEDEILRRLGIIKFNAEKALKISMLITRSNFKTQKTEQIADIVKYIEQYISIYSNIYEQSVLKFEIKNENAELIKKISLLDISVILDDLISNSEKAGAKRILIEISNPIQNSLKIIFSDDGKGVPRKFDDNLEQIFELGVTTTDGSGIGLHSVRTALKSMSGNIKYLGNDIKLRGASFEINFN
jgi:signal transduction histidine kinase